MYEKVLRPGNRLEIFIAVWAINIICNYIFIGVIAYNNHSQLRFISDMAVSYWSEIQILCTALMHTIHFNILKKDNLFS